jgi:hypothetical protein
MSHCLVDPKLDVHILGRAVVSLGQALVERGRLQAIRSFFDSSLEKRNADSRIYSASFECAGQIFEFCDRFLSLGEPAICWSDEAMAPGKFSDGDFTPNDVIPAIASTERRIHQALSFLRLRLDSELNDRLLRLLHATEIAAFGSIAACDYFADAPEWRQDSGIAKVFCAPVDAALDPIFEKTYSLTIENAAPPVGECSVADIARRCWLTAMHEGMASRLCIITLFEYDGLPFSFYNDLAKQAADEANHAVRFLRCAKLLIDELSASSHQWSGMRYRLDESGTGLPVPFEGDFYPSIRAADLLTRMTWMHVDTEGPGVGSLIALSQELAVARRPAIRQALEYIIEDEITHARFGRHWVRMLENEACFIDMDDARLLRGLLLTETVAHSNNMTLSDFVKL